MLDLKEALSCFQFLPFNFFRFRLATPVILLAFGSLCTLLGFLGCCGAIRENYCLTVSFAVLLALVIVSASDLMPSLDIIILFSWKQLK